MNYMQLSQPSIALRHDNFGYVAMRSVASSRHLTKQTASVATRSTVFTDKVSKSKSSTSRSTSRRNWSVSKAAPRCVLASDDVLAVIPTQPATKLCFLLVCDAFNSMAQRAWLKLRESGHDVTLHVFTDGDSMVAAVDDLKPDVIICPFLTKRIPRAVYTGSVPCLVIHPGIEGDRGMSSIDWALHEAEHEWGVTILQAEEEMDAGPIWATSNFLTRRSLGSPPTKSSLYRIECIDAAMQCIDVVLYNLKHNVPPRLLDYSKQNVRGTLRPKLRQVDRCLNWELPAEDLARIIRAGDSQPGTLSIVAEEKFLLFGSHTESNPPDLHADSTGPMEILGQRDGAILIRCGGGTALWITHLKKNVKSIKLPAVAALKPSLASTLRHVDAPPLELPMGIWPQTFQEIFYWTKHDVTYLWFDFYNGAMSTDQCRRLASVLDHLDRVCTSKVLVLMGGVNYFSNGIHLNTIEAAVDPVQESWENINAIDDVVLRILTCSKRVTVAAMMGNAGAGGVMMAIAADEVWAHGNVVMHPSYKPMELYGSEYWTHSLPKRVEAETAARLVASVEPVSVVEAEEVGLVDAVLAPSSVGFLERVIERAEKISKGKQWSAVVDKKQRELPELKERLQQHRHRELVQMQANFESEIYNQKRRDFVYKSAGTLSCQTELVRPLKDESWRLASQLLAWF